MPQYLKPLLLTNILVFILTQAALAQKELDACNITWTTQSSNSSESMPCGGGDIGLNVWVENGDLLFYMSRSGAFDENNALLKLGRTRICLSPNPFEGTKFSQQLSLKTGAVTIEASGVSLQASVRIWADVFQPVVHASITSKQNISAEIFYESWRYQDHLNSAKENRANSYKWEPLDVYTRKDSIAFENKGIVFFHRNSDSTVFDVTVKYEEMESVKGQLFNPLRELCFGGKLVCSGAVPDGLVEGNYVNTPYRAWRLRSVKPQKSYDLTITFHTGQTASIQEWKDQLNATIERTTLAKAAWARNQEWWFQFWNRSFIHIKPQTASESDPAWQVGRNYQLFRYMLACNAFGSYPTKFNGGLFTYDPVFIDTGQRSSADYRNWGGGVHTAQNQRLVYFPMIRSGDFDLMKPQFDFYLRILKNAELRSSVYWNHAGACFTEQMENYGLPNPAEYSRKRPAGFDKGVEYNAWLEYEWDTVLEFCLMMLEEERYSGNDISSYLPFIESCLRFFDEHYQYLAKLRGRKSLDGNNQLVLYPGSGGETFKMAYNSTSTIAALQTITKRMLELPAKYLGKEKREYLKGFFERIPPISFSETNGRKTIAPAKNWERVNNTEPTQLYPVFPWGMYGVGKPDLETARNTYFFDTLALKFRSYVGWKQDNIFAARLGLTEESKRLAILKLQNSGRRFPAFWGPGFDWTPDHNWGGSGMIGVQEMLLQVDDRKIYLFPAWPKDWDVHFKLHAPYQTTVEAEIKNGKLVSMRVVPEERAKDVTNLF